MRVRLLPLAIMLLAACDTPSPTPLEPRLQEAVLADPAGAGYVRTPAGFYHRSCVNRIPSGSRVEPRGDGSRIVHLPNGRTYELPSCRYEVIPINGPTGVDATADRVPTTDGWVMQADSIDLGSGTFRNLSANWTVPAAPTGPSGSVYFTFPGLQNRRTSDLYDDIILQPVLQYGVSRFGGNYWAIASWYCSRDSMIGCDYSDPIAVSPGTELYGSIVATSCSNGVCNWTVTTRLVATGEETTLGYTDEDDYDWAFAGAVEVYDVDYCSQYPQNGVFYTNLALYNQSSTRIYPRWTERFMKSPSPSCDFNIERPSTMRVEFFHNPAPAPSMGTLTINPDPAQQYQSFSINITGSGFNTATAEALIYGPDGTLCCAYIRNSDWTTTHYNQLYKSSFILSIAGTYTIRVRNGLGGKLSDSRSFVVDPI